MIQPCKEKKVNMTNIMKLFESGIVWEQLILIKLMKLKINFIWHYYLNSFKLSIIPSLEKIKIATHLSLSPFCILNTGKRGFPDSAMYCSLDSIGGSSGISAKTSVSGKQPCEEIKEC